MPIIYKAVSPSGKIYIGVTKHSISIRKSQHEHCALKKNSELLFHKAIRKYGPELFHWEILYETVDIKEALEMEKFFIKSFESRGSGYNMTDGGDSKHEVTQKTREKLSKASKGCKNPRYGKECGEETKLKISQANKGKLKGLVRGSMKESTKEILSKKAKDRFGDEVPGHLASYIKENGPVWKGRKHSCETRSKQSLSSKTRIQIKCLDTGEVFPSVMALSRKINKDNSWLCKKIPKNTNIFTIDGLTYAKEAVEPKN